MLNLKNAYARLEQAKKQEQTLQKAFNDWTASEGIQIVLERDPQFARYGFFVVMHKEPEENLALIAGEIFNNLRSVLDYIAFQIYLAGGGDPEAKQAKSVAFPIVVEEARWDKAVKANVPYAWDEAIQKLQWCQPFVQFYPQTTALPALQGVGATDKHRDLVLYAMGVMGVSGISPEIQPNQSLIVMMPKPGPVVDINEPHVVGLVYMRRGGEITNIADEELLPWSELVGELKAPPPPKVNFGFRANDGSEVTIEAVPQLIGYVEQVLKLFKDLKTPPKPSPAT